MRHVRTSAARWFPAPGRAIRILGILGWGLLGCGCETARFYTQAVRGHGQVLWRQQSIPKLVQDEKVDPVLRAQLKLLLELRAFAEAELGLPASRHYLHYVAWDRPHVVWDVYAAPEFSLEPKTWWYPVVGRMSYRGYFRKAQAEACAARLQARGYDVYVGGVDAYSTLGWFRDPVLSTFLDRSPADLADLIFHELAHQRFFVRGDTEFNEAFATATARAGVRRWLQAQGPDAAPSLARWEEGVRRQDAFMHLILETRRRLEACYQSGEEDALALQRGKAKAFSDMRAAYAVMKTDWGGWGGYDAWFEAPVNNARLNAEATYYELGPALAGILEDLGGDLERFYRVVEALGKLPREERRRRLKQEYSARDFSVWLPGPDPLTCISHRAVRNPD